MVKNAYWSSLKYPLFLSDFNQTLISSTDLKKKYPHIKFHDNSFCGNRVIPRVQTEGGIYRQTERRKGKHGEVNSRSSKIL